MHLDLVFLGNPSPSLSPLASCRQFKRTTFLDQSRQITGPFLRLLDRHPHQSQQRIVQFVGIAHDRPGFAFHLLDRLGIQRADLAEQLGRQRPSHFDRAGPPLLQRCIVKKRIGVGIENLMRERRRRRRIDGETTNLLAFDRLQEGRESVEIHRLGQTITQGFRNQGMIGNLPRRPFARQILLAGNRVREDGGQQVLGFHPLDLRRHFLPLRKPEQRQRPRGIPAPARGEHRRQQHCLYEYFPH